MPFYYIFVVAPFLPLPDDVVAEGFSTVLAVS